MRLGQRHRLEGSEKQGARGCEFGVYINIIYLCIEQMSVDIFVTLSLAFGALFMPLRLCDGLAVCAIQFLGDLAVVFGNKLMPRGVLGRLIGTSFPLLS